MNSNNIYVCPKCHNSLPYSNKMLHDLKCTRDNPVQFSLQNPTASYDFDYDNNSIDYNNYNNGNNYYNSSQRNSKNSRLSSRMSITNDDGTTTEIKKDTNMSGKEELLEITYDPQGNIIGRKKADGGSSNVRYTFRDMLEYKDSNMPENYYIYEGSNVYVETVPEYNYVITNQNNNDYGYGMINNQGFQHDFGRRGYSLMQSNITNSYLVNPNTNNSNNINNYSIDFGLNNNYDNQISNYSDNIFNNNYNYNIINSMNPFEQNQNNINNNGEPIKYAKVTKLK